MSSTYLLIVTGASRGFGKALCLQMAKSILGPLDCVLVGRSREELENTEAEMQSVRTGCRVNSQIVVGDLSDSSNVEGIAREMFERSYDYTKVVYISNAGTLGPINTIDSSLNIDSFTKAIQLNSTSPCLLLSYLLGQVKNRGSSAKSIVCVNVSSLWATEPAKTMSAYCTSKAATEMFFEVAAAEYSSHVQVKFLNYAPGPLDTAMQAQIREDSGVDAELRESCSSLKETGKLLSPQESALKCTRIVVEEIFKNGDHIDYYDPIEGVDYPRKTPTTCCANPDCQCGPACSCSPALGAQCGACRSFLLGNR